MLNIIQTRGYIIRLRKKVQIVVNLFYEEFVLE